MTLVGDLGGGDVFAEILDDGGDSDPEIDELNLPVANTPEEPEKAEPLPVGENPLTPRLSRSSGRLRFMGGLPASGGKVIGETSTAISGTKVRGLALGYKYSLVTSNPNTMTGDAQHTALTSHWVS